MAMFLKFSELQSIHQQISDDVQDVFDKGILVYVQLFQ